MAAGVLLAVIACVQARPHASRLSSTLCEAIEIKWAQHGASSIATCSADDSEGEGEDDEDDEEDEESSSGEEADEDAPDDDVGRRDTTKRHAGGVDYYSARAMRHGPATEVGELD